MATPLPLQHTPSGRDYARSPRLKMALCALVSLPCSVWGQSSLPPWISPTPGMEHPAAWSMGERPIHIGIQQDTRWNGSGDPLTGLWFGAGWQPQAKGGYNRKSSDPISFGVSLKEDPLSTGWRERSLSVSASASTPISQDWKAHAGLSIGASTWRLDPSSWSWDAQYGPGGYDPLASNGEAIVNEANGGARIDMAISVGISPARIPQRNGGLGLKGALTLHHLSHGKAPHLSPVPQDTVRWRPSWWLEGQGNMGWEKLEWRVWNRGTLQAHSHLLELGMAIGRPFGTTARFTKTRISHHIETGALWRSDGVLRLILGWERNGLSLSTGPAWSVGSMWRPAAGWSVGLSWSPDMQGTVALQR
jgi:hypothetical protein